MLTIIEIITQTGSSATENTKNGLLNVGASIVSAFFGGFFAALWANHFESKRRVHDKRRDKYFEHRNTIVQIEHELIPLRISTSRNSISISDAIKHTNNLNVRFILRFYRLTLSPGFSLKLLSLDFINKYSQLYSLVEKINSDFDYVSNMVNSIIQDKKMGKIDQSAIDSYKVFLPHLKEQCDVIEDKSKELLATAQLAIGKEDENIREKYIKDGKEIKYLFEKKTLGEKYKKIAIEEDSSFHKDEVQPKFVSPYLDFKKVVMRTPV